MRAASLADRLRRLAGSSARLDELLRFGLPQLCAGSNGAPAAARLRPALAALMRRHDELLGVEILPQLAARGIELRGAGGLRAVDRAALRARFQADIYPVLTPFSVDATHPFPHISNLALNLLVALREPAGGLRIAQLKVPRFLPRLHALPSGHRISIEEVIRAELGALFPGLEVESSASFRVTRGAGEGHPIVRVELAEGSAPRLRQLLARVLPVTPEDVYARREPLDVAGLGAALAPELARRPARRREAPAAAESAVRTARSGFSPT